MRSILATFLLLSFIASLTSCSSSSNDTGNGLKLADTPLTLVHTDTINIPIDSASLNHSLYPVYYANDTVEYYIAGNEFLNSVDFYDLGKRKLVKRNIYPEKGETGFTSPLRIYVKSLDSIYVFSKEEFQMVLTNYDGDYLGRYNVNVMAIPNAPAVSFSTNLFQPFKVIGNHAYFGFWVNGDPRFQPGHKTIAKYNLVTNEYEEFGSPFPMEFKDGLYRGATPEFTFGPADNNIVVRFGALPYLFNYDITTGDTTKHSAGSVHRLSPIVPDRKAEKPSDMDDDFEDLRQDSYGGVFYDRYAKVYYSLFMQGIPIYDSAGNKSSFESKPVSIMVFNENFEFCGEHLLKENIYFWRNIIPSKNGLLIPMSHPDNRDAKPGVLQFAVFKLAESSYSK